MSIYAENSAPLISIDNVSDIKHSYEIPIWAVALEFLIWMEVIHYT